MKAFVETNKHNITYHSLVVIVSTLLISCNFFKKSAIRIIFVSFLAGCQFSGRDKLSRYPGASATLGESQVVQEILHFES